VSGRYLAEHAERLSPGTLRTHLAALAQWHLQHGFVDPTKALAVREVLRGFKRCTRGQLYRPSRCN
jgi:hypothetical protein